MVHQEFLEDYCFCFLLCIKIPKPLFRFVRLFVFGFKKEKKILPVVIQKHSRLDAAFVYMQLN